MWLYALQIALGLANLGVTVLMRKQGRIGPWSLIALQVPWTAYDVWFPATRGFIVLSVTGVIVGIRMLRKQQ